MSAADSARGEQLAPDAALGLERRRVRLTIAYDGSDFAGFAFQPGQRTVSGELAGAISQVVGEPIALTCAGRTDAGVHAWGQVVHADVPELVGRRRHKPLEPARLAKSCNAMLGPQVIVREAAWAEPGFDARRSALARIYRYQVLAGPVPDPALARTAWHLELAELSLAAMQEASGAILGEHDFSAFCRRAPDGGSLVRVVLGARWVRLDVRAGRVYRFEVEASSFCHQMVRSLVGTLVEVGRGRRRPQEMAKVISARERSLAASPAPPHGLCLWEVRYPSPAGSGGHQASPAGAGGHQASADALEPS